MILPFWGEGVDHVTCQICKKRFKKIAWRHLRYKHNITFADYALRFPKAMVTSLKNKPPNLIKKGTKLPKWWGEKISKAKKGKRTITPAQSLAISRSNKTRTVSAETRKQMSESGKTFLRENPRGEMPAWIRQKISNSLMGEKIARWRGGRNSVYCEGWGGLANKTRKRDNNKCLMCNRFRSLEERDFQVHHIDKNTQNNQQNNLITLCSSCHKGKVHLSCDSEADYEIQLSLLLHDLYGYKSKFLSN